MSGNRFQRAFFCLHSALFTSSASALATSASTTSYLVSLLVVRHGETNYNAEGRIQGTLDSVLTERGEQQARRLGRWLSTHEPNLGRVVVSPKKRTRQTLAAITAEHPMLSSAQVPVEVRPGLREIELTAWEGKKRADIASSANSETAVQDADGERWKRWKTDPMSFIFEEDGHAPLQCLWQRADNEWTSLREKAAAVIDSQVANNNAARQEFLAPTLVVAHGAFNRALLGQALGLPMVTWRDEKEHFIFDNCECVEFEWCYTPGFPPLDDGMFATRWRRRYPRETSWMSRREEAERAAKSEVKSL